MDGMVRDPLVCNCVWTTCEFCENSNELLNFIRRESSRPNGRLLSLKMDFAPWSEVKGFWVQFTSQSKTLLSRYLSTRKARLPYVVPNSWHHWNAYLTTLSVACSNFQAVDSLRYAINVFFRFRFTCQ